MRYLKVAWHHDLADEPIMVYSEIDHDGYETRKVEVYRDGRHDFADQSRATGTTWLGEKPIPGIDEISAVDEFSPEEIDAEEFDEVWARTQG